MLKMRYVFLFMNLNEYACWTKKEQECELIVELLVNRQTDCERKSLNQKPVRVWPYSMSERLTVSNDLCMNLWILEWNV